MRPPTSALFGATRTTEQPAAGRRGIQAARRAVIVQCDRCSVHGTGSATSAGRVVSVNLPATYARNCGWRHGDCGGALIGFDTSEVDQ